MKKWLAAVLVFLTGIVVTACGSAGGIFDFCFNFGGGGTKGADATLSSAEPLVIAAATELEDLEPAIASASADLGFEIHM